MAVLFAFVRRIASLVLAAAVLLSSGSAPAQDESPGQEARADDALSEVEPLAEPVPLDRARAAREADEELARLELRKSEYNALLVRRQAAGRNPPAELVAEVDAAAAALAAQATLLRRAADQLERLGGDPSRYRARATAITGRFDGARDLGFGVLVALVRGWFDQAYDYVLEQGPRLLFQAFFALVLWTAFLVLSRFIGRVIRRALASPRVKASALLKDFLIGLASKAVMLVGILVLLNQLGVQVGPLLAGLGIAGFIMGFALQDTLSNFAAGVMILFYRPFDIGHFVRAGGEVGTVREVSLVNTVLDTPDNQRLIIPNKKIWGDTIQNTTINPTRRVDLVIGVSYGDEIAHVQAVLERVVKAHPLVLADPAPVIRVHALNQSSVDFAVRPWVKSPDYWTVHSELTRRIKEAFDEVGITIPFPQRDVHMYQHGART